MSRYSGLSLSGAVPESLVEGWPTKPRSHPSGKEFAYFSKYKLGFKV